MRYLLRTNNGYHYTIMRSTKRFGTYGEHLLRCCPFYVGLTQYSYNNNNRLNPNPHRSYCHSAGNLFRAGNLARASKFFRAPVSLGIPRSVLPDSESTQHASHGLSPGHTRAYVHMYTQKGRLSSKLERVVTPPSDLPETSASPTRVTAVITGMFHTPQTITMRPRPTLLDSAGLPPGLSSTNMRPYNKTHSSLRTGCAAQSAPLLRTLRLYLFTEALYTTT